MVSIPLDEWPDGWLKLECSSLLNEPTYIILYDSEKAEKGYPVTREEMIKYIRQEWGKEGFTR